MLWAGEAYRYAVSLGVLVGRHSAAVCFLEWAVAWQRRAFGQAVFQARARLMCGLFRLRSGSVAG